MRWRFTVFQVKVEKYRQREKFMYAEHMIESSASNQFYAGGSARRLIDFQVWPATTRTMDVQGWLSNFEKEELPYAEALLSHFLYYSRSLTDQLFSVAFGRLLPILVSRSPETDRAKIWKEFCANCIVTFPTGEQPNPTDSGPAFARKARQVIGIREKQILEPAAAIKEIIRGPARPVVLVDDFCGSGTQLIDTLNRPYDIPGDRVRNLGVLVKQTEGVELFSVSCLSTSVGVDRVEEEFPDCRMVSGHVLDEQDCIFNEAARVWSSLEDKSAGPEFVRQASKRAGISDIETTGFADLGLALAFEDSTPDATAPIFYFESPNWRPLVRRL
jgi:hypothetical protein